jgi:hypothetical protein
MYSSFRHFHSKLDWHAYGPQHCNCSVWAGHFCWGSAAIPSPPKHFLRHRAPSLMIRRLPGPPLQTAFPTHPQPQEVYPTYIFKLVREVKCLASHITSGQDLHDIATMLHLLALWLILIAPKHINTQSINSSCSTSPWPTGGQQHYIMTSMEPESS